MAATTAATSAGGTSGCTVRAVAWNLFRPYWLASAGLSVRFPTVPHVVAVPELTCGPSHAAAAGHDGVVRVWDARCLSRTMRELRGHQGAVTSVRTGPNAFRLGRGGGLVDWGVVAGWGVVVGGRRGPAAP